MNEHEYYVELCAGYALGTLAPNRIEELDHHLENCTECREAIQQFHDILSMGLPALAPDIAEVHENSTAEAALQKAEQRIFARIHNQISPRIQKTCETEQRLDPRKSARHEVLRSYVSGRLAFPIVVIVLAICGAEYWHLSKISPARSAEAHHSFVPSEVPDSTKNPVARPEEREALTAQVAEKAVLERITKELHDKIIEKAALENQLQTSNDALQRVQAQVVLEHSTRVSVEQRLGAVQESLSDFQQRLDIAIRERDSYLVTNTALERRIEDLSGALREKGKVITEQAELLGESRDIRDVVGARHLYIAEVSDVGRDGTQVPFGRVFFTKEKSLIFYAYDLDRENGTRRAVAFQAWGRRGKDFSEALPLGIMYLDSSAKRRWILRLDDPETLAKINGVFVTIEPAGGSKRPTSKPLLFASLQIEPNHL